MNIKEISNQNIMNTYGRLDIVLKKGKGVYVEDSEGKEYIDLGAGIGVNALGFCDEGWVKAVCDQAGTLQHTSNLYYTYPATKLAEKLCKDSSFNKVFFANSGAEANECAIKLARKYSTDKYSKERNEIITLEQSFHGRTVTTLAATGQDSFHQYFYPFTEGFAYAKPDIEAIREKISDKTCAVFIECIQGEGGVNILDKKLVQDIEKLCREKDLLFIVDEVQTGIGRTGSLYCFENYDVKPDIITLAKGLGGGLPIGACLCTEGLENVLTQGAHGSTFGGNPISCAAGLYTLEEIEKDDFIAKVKEKGDYFAQKLEELEEVKEVRHMGLMIGIVLKKDNAKEVSKKCLDEGLLVLTAKDVVRLLPPLNITKEEIDEAIERFKKAV